ncbi:MAG: hypothetical protein ABSC94_26875 [Polyangiaceae bacterium]|jgi:hypothetical protein
MSAFDPEIEQFKRSIDLAEYAKKTGYELRPGESKDFMFLEHPSRDRIVVARNPSGQWIYASVNSYEPRSPAESPDHASRRMRDCVLRTKDKGSIVEFVRNRDCTARHGEVPLEVVRARLRGYRESGRPLDFEGPLHLSPGVVRTPRAPDRAGDMVGRGVDSATMPAGPRNDRNQDAITERIPPGRRRYDWTPPPECAGAVLHRAPRGRSPDRGR